MKNILIVCADKILRQDISRVLARELGFLYADIDEILDYELLSGKDATLIDAGEQLQQLEVKSIVKALGFDKCVLSVSCNLFVSNANFKLFNMPKVFVCLSKSHMIARSKFDSHRLEQELLLFDKINRLISINCEIVMDRDVKTVEEIVQHIIEKLKDVNIY